MQLNIHIANSIDDFPYVLRFIITEDPKELIDAYKGKKEVKDTINKLYDSLNPLENREYQIFSLRIDVVNALIEKLKRNDCPLYHNPIYIIYYEKETLLYKISLLDILHYKYRIFEINDIIKIDNLI